MDQHVTDARALLNASAWLVSASCASVTRRESVTRISMLFISNRVKFCSLAFTAARMYATGAQANNNPVVFFDIAADNEPLGRVTFEVRAREATNSTMRKARLMNINDVRLVSSSDWLKERETLNGWRIKEFLEVYEY